MVRNGGGKHACGTPRELRLRDFWERRRGALRERVWRLELAAARRRAGRLSPELRDQAHFVAGQLAASLGVFGFVEGSALASEVERMFADEAVPAEVLVDRVSVLAERLESFTP